MRSAIFYACLLLIPVVLLLFIALRMRKKIVYPHGLILLDKKDKPTDFLMRLMRLYGDLVFDALLAVSIAFFLAGYPQIRQKNSAVIVDSSLSMTRGFAGARGIDLACREIFNNKEFSSSDFYLLEFDGPSKITRLFLANKLKKDYSSQLSLVKELEKRNQFHSIDYSAVSRLLGKHYKNIALLTDNENLTIDGIEIKLLETARIELSYPAQSFYDSIAGESIIHFYSKDSSRLEQVLYMDGTYGFVPPKPGSFRIEKTPSGFTLRIKDPGIWALQENGGILPFNAPGPGNPAKAEGNLAAKISKIIAPNSPASLPGRPQLTISEKKTGRSRNLLRITIAETETCVFDPAKTLGTLVASGYTKSADITLTPAAFASADSSLAFLTELHRTNQQPYASTAKTDSLTRSGDGYIAVKKSGIFALAAGPEEYFPFTVTVDSVKPELQIHRLAIFIFLFGAFTLKALSTVKLLRKRR